jgi:hypothetical protein
MYRVFGAQKLASYFALFVGAIFFALWFQTRPSDPSTLWRLFSTSAAIGAATTFIFGQTPIFPFLCRHTPLWHLFPDVDGEWYAQLDSNWSEIAVRAGLPASTQPVTGTMGIKARLFTIKLRYMSITPEPEYLGSQTLSVQVHKDTDDGRIRLFYIFEGEARFPTSTDTSHHYGAAYLDLIDMGNEHSRLSGLYWTNRNWSKGLNTAGTIELQRSS